MEQVVKPFAKFLPGSHLILGEAGSGKTRLIWSILQEKDYVVDNSINIVLTDSEKRIWYNPAKNPIVPVDPFDTDISWVTEPSKPGIYYCACEYAPRVITFLECLASWAIRNENKLTNKVRIFIDFPVKYWTLPEFVEQLSRLQYIVGSQSTVEEISPIEIWTVLGPFKKISPQAKEVFKNVNMVLLNPFPQGWFKNISSILDLESADLPNLMEGIDPGIKDGYYYVPCVEKGLYLNSKPIKQFKS
ncbi:MAG: hypothetical protein APF84_01540 [Gracilibacter sp. BRH_c7a]|nr:MAG: hypothetical protein APF84_01540 [Gracilibacter sp. BRH_c7a]